VGGAYFASIQLARFADEEPAIPVVLFWVAVGGVLLSFLSHLVTALFLADVAYYFDRKPVARSAFAAAALLLLAMVAFVVAVSMNSLVDLESQAYKMNSAAAGRPDEHSAYNVTPAILMQTASLALLVLYIIWHLLLLGSVRRIIRQERKAALAAAE
jgi:hypothetical protein